MRRRATFSGAHSGKCQVCKWAQFAQGRVIDRLGDHCPDTYKVYCVSYKTLECLGCLMPELPPPGTTPTCDTAGILGPAVNVIASFEAMEAIKILSGNLETTNHQLMIFEMWHNRVR